MKSKFKMENFFCVLILIYGMCHRVSSQVPGNNDTIGCVETSTERTCYFAYKDLYNWDEAWSSCQTANGQLALLNTEEIDNMVGAYMNRITENLDGDYLVWIGGREMNNPSWKWLDGKLFTSGNTSDTMVYFSLQRNRYETCAVVGSNGTSGLYYKSAPCKSARNYFICYNSLTSNDTNSTWNQCSIGSNVGVAYNNRCYVTIPASTPLTWFQARYECNKMNSDLAVFNDSRDHDLIRSLLGTGSNQTFWIGLREYEWVWSTAYDAVNGTITGRQEISYSGWFSGNPVSRGKSCMAMLGRTGTDHGWMNANCSETHPFICQQITIITTTAPTTTPPITTPPITTPPNKTPGPTIFYEYVDKNVTVIIEDHRSGAVCGGYNYKQCVASIVVPAVIVAIVLIIIGFTIYCYFSKRREGYLQHK